MKTLANKRGNILTQNIIFIVLNLVFLTILVIFLFSKTGTAAVLEEKHAKEIALILDSVEPGMTIFLNMENAIKIANKENRNLDEVVSVQDNIVTVQLREKGSYSYSFFNNLVYGTDFTIYPDKTTTPIKNYVIFVEDSN